MARNVEEPYRCKTSKSIRGKTATSRRKRKEPEYFQPTDWLSLTKPNKTPYYPQMGDDCMYFRQGHQNYVDAVKENNLYEMELSSLPWAKEIRPVRQQEWVKIIGIDYKIKPPRLICLKLGIIDPISGILTRKSFSIEYHDMDDIVDFLVLKQEYDTAIKRQWKSKQKFRSIMNDGRGVQMWWEGEFIKSEPLDAEFPESMFLCYCVRWDNGDNDRLSPWDLENIDAGRRPNKTGTSVQLLPLEISTLLLYKPKTDDWPPLGDRDFECDRISRGISEALGLYEAKHFIAPVNLELFPDYAFVVKYPIDLSTIKARLDNRFYRRAIAVEYDVLRICTNARKFNDPKSDIVRNSCIITDLCLEIIRNREVDFIKFHQELIKKYICNKVKKPVGKQVDEKHQIKQSSSFALTFTNRVGGSRKSSESVHTSNQKLIFKPSQSSPLVSSNHISFKVSSSFTVDKPNTDVDLTTDCDQSSESLNQQNRNETTNMSRKKKKSIDLVDIEIVAKEQSHKRWKTVSINPPAAINSEIKFSDTAVQECDSAVATHLNEDDLLTNILKGESKSKENLDSTCTTASSLPGLDDVGSQVDVTVKSAVYSPNDFRILGINKKKTPTPRARINHVRHKRIRRKETDTPLMIKKKSLALYNPFITPMPIAVSSPMKVCQKTSLFQNTSLGEMGKHKRKLGGWSISFQDYSKGFVDALNGPVLKDRPLEMRFSKPMFQSPMFETAEMKSCYKSNILYQCSEGKITPLLTQETSTLDAADITVCPTASSLTDSDTKLKRRHNVTRVKSPSTVGNLSNPNFTSPKESESPSSQSTDDDNLIEQILAESKFSSTVSNPSNPNFTSPKESESTSSQSTDNDLIEQILAESKFSVLKQKTRKEKSEKKKNKMPAAPCLLKVNKNSKRSLSKKSIYKKNEARSKVSPTSNVIPLEGNKKQSVKSQITPTPTKVVDSNSCETDRFSFNVQEMLTEHKFNATVANKTNSKEKDKFFESTDPTGKLGVLEESELSSSQSTDEVIKQILAAAESKFAILKQKTGKEKTEKKKNSKLSAIPHLSKVKEECRLTHTNVAYSILDEKNRIAPPIRKKKSKMERQSRVEISINNTNLKEKEEIFFKTIEVNQQSVCPEEKKCSSESTISKCAALKHKTSSKNKSKKKKRSLNQHSECNSIVFTEEDNSSFSQSDDAIIEQILSEAKNSISKPSVENSVNRSRCFRSQRPVTSH